MVEIGIDNIHLYVEFGGHVYQQTVDMPMCINCAPLVIYLFLYSYEADFVQHLQKSKFNKPKTSFDLTCRYMDMVISLNNPKFNDYINVIYPEEFDIKHTTDAPKWANGVDLCLEFDVEGKLHTRLYDFPSQLFIHK